MKTVPKFLITILAIAALSGCAVDATAAQSEDIVSVAYTQAAMTVGAQLTSTLPATVTPFPTAIPTLYVPQTLAVISPTAQSVKSNISYSTANGCNDAIYVSDVTIPDGTILAPGEVFTKTWEFQNTGSCDWDEDYLIVFVSGTGMDGDTTEIDQDVSTDSAGDISVYLTAPDTEGTYTGYWRLTDSDGNAFGESVYVMIVVSDDAATVTPTPTETEEVTATSEPTSTPEPTEVFTSTPISTEEETVTTGSD